MRRIWAGIFLFLLMCSNALATDQYFWRYRLHATDCTALTDGKLRDLCYEQDSQNLYKCDTATCSTPSDWKKIVGSSGGGGDEIDPVVKAVVGIVKSNGSTISAASAGTDYVAPAGNVATATALAANPTDCSANQFANAIAASGNLSCSAIADADVPDTITASNYLPLSGGTLTGDLTLSADSGEGLLGGGLTDCDNSTTSKLLWDSTTHKFSCGTDQNSGGGYTNLTSFVDQTAWRLFYSNGSGDVTELALGADGTYLKSNGATSAPSFDTPSGSGDVTGVGNCASGACLDGTSDGGTYLDFYDADGAGRLIAGNLTAARTWTTPDSTGTIALTSDVKKVKLTVCSSTATGPCDYTCDGTADDVQIQAAIDAANAVELSDGTFNISAKINIDDYQTLSGQGYTTHLKAIAGLNTDVAGNEDTTNGNSNIIVRGIRFDANNTEQTANNNAFFATKVTYSIWENCWFEKGHKETWGVAGGEGLSLHESNYNLISDSFFLNNQYDGLKFRGAKYNTVTNIYSAENGRSGVQIASNTDSSIWADYNTFSNITVYHSTGTPYGSNPTTSGFYIHEGRYNTISNLNVYGTRQGIGMYGADTHNVFVGGVLQTRYNSKYVIDLEDANQNYNVVRGFTMLPISGAAGGIIHVVSSSNNNVIADNYFNNGSGTGTWTISIAGTGNKITGNNFLDSPSVSDSGTSTVWKNNTGISKDGILGTSTDVFNFSSSSFLLPNGASDATLSTAGAMHLNTTDEQLSFHSSTDGEISGEASISLLRHLHLAIDPAAWYDQESVYRVVPLPYIGDDSPEGITITQWKLAYVGGNPTTELDADLICDTTPDFNPAAGATVMDVLDTTDGASAADTGFDSASCANGSQLYLRFGADPADANVVISFDLWFYNEED